MTVDLELQNDFKIAMGKIKELQRENNSLRSQNKILKEKYEDLWVQNKLQMSKIVEYRRLIEHYEDGAPLYVQVDS